MANHPNSLPLYEKISCKSIPQRVTDVSIFLLLLCLLLYRVLHFATQGLVWRLAFFSECWFTLYWFMIASTKWSPCHYKTYPERLLQRYGFEDLPALDMFVTTADSSIEPPIITVNTVLSLLAVDYPTQKLACYVSDDGCSVLTFYSLVEAAKFARSWVPFCKKYGVEVRAPFMYFSQKHDTPFEDSSVFAREWGKMKNEYEELRRKIEEAAQNPFPWQLSGELASFSNVERGNHSAIVKAIWENKEGPDGLPHIIYVAREKRPKVPHNSKAGAMNALIRVSGVMTNAPFTLNVDCDMYANNPQVVLNAMCLLLGIQNEKQCAYVQFPQRFYGGLKDDPFGTSYIVLQKYLYLGTSGIQGPSYGGSGCFHRRKVIYGLSPPDEFFKGKKLNAINGNEALERRFGHSELSKSAARILNEEITDENPNGCNLQSATEAANVVAGSHYEFNTCWGQEVGLVYGSTTEDIVTGTKIQSRGWESAYCETDPPAFLGCAPSHGPSVMKQQKRWATGLMQVVLGRHSPLIGTLAHKLRFRQCLAYITIYAWPLRSLPELCYSLLPPFCLLTHTSFLPKVSDPVIVVPAALFLLYNLSTMEEYLSCGLSVRAWWNNQRMQRIISATAWLFGVMGYCLDCLGLSEALFVVTPKDQTPPDSNEDEDDGKFTFDSSSIFIPGVALLFVQLTALAYFLLGLQPAAAKEGFGSGPGLGEVVCSLWLVLSFLPYIRGLFRRGSYGIPWPTIYKAAALTFLFVHSCRDQFFKHD